MYAVACMCFGSRFVMGDCTPCDVVEAAPLVYGVEEGTVPFRAVDVYMVRNDMGRWEFNFLSEVPPQLELLACSPPAIIP
jgi:hypothetical protein